MAADRPDAKRGEVATRVGLDSPDSGVGSLEVRGASIEDSEALALAHVRAWQAAYPGLMPQQYLDGMDLAERADVWRRRLGEPLGGSRLLVAAVHQQVAGFTTFGAARDDASGDAGELYALNVHPDHWRVGVGSALLSAAHAGLADLGHHKAVLWVVPGNERARRFYEGRGWILEGNERSIKLQGVTVPEVRYGRRVP